MVPQHGPGIKQRLQRGPPPFGRAAPAGAALRFHLIASASGVCLTIDLEIHLLIDCLAILGSRVIHLTFPKSGVCRTAWIKLPIALEFGREFPGILGPMTFRPETAAPINELINILLRNESTLTPGEREMIATHVSWCNDCFFCQTIHGAVAAAQLGNNEELV